MELFFTSLHNYFAITHEDGSDEELYVLQTISRVRDAALRGNNSGPDIWHVMSIFEQLYRVLIFPSSKVLIYQFPWAALIKNRNIKIHFEDIDYLIVTKWLYRYRIRARLRRGKTVTICASLYSTRERVNKIAEEVSAVIERPLRL